ncbi:hypothetical protein C8T65DRAFT_635310 [Cerioporus squamosus]|nr:hypothetical protein C8T65DRAFT_635310 [Cerioporus squamosus]
MSYPLACAHFRPPRSHDSPTVNPARRLYILSTCLRGRVYTTRCSLSPESITNGAAGGVPRGSHVRCCRRACEALWVLGRACEASELDCLTPSSARRPAVNAVSVTQSPDQR